MSDMNEADYYAGRAEASRQLAERAADPEIAAIHREFAARYEANVLLASVTSRKRRERSDQLA